jgi:hypothetical protein
MIQLDVAEHVSIRALAGSARGRGETKATAV